MSTRTRRPSSDTTVRVEAAVLQLGRFGVSDLCAYTGLTDSQVRPVLRILREDGYVVTEAVRPARGGRPPHRPAGQYRLTSQKTKLRSFTDRVYQLRQALAPAGSEGASLEALRSNLARVELMIELCGSEPRTHQQLQRVEGELEAIYLELEDATYKAAVRVSDPGNAQHPIVLTWNRFNSCKETWDRIADRWTGEPARIQIVTDPCFLDSALFLWVCRQLPQRTAERTLEYHSVQWQSVPGHVAERPGAIGFYNRVVGPESDQRVSYWADLCAYRGYALLAHPQLGLTARPKSLEESQRFLQEFLQYWRKEQMHPSIISIGADTVWRLGSNLTRDISTDQFYIENHDANVAFARFREQKHSLFIGGLPQRLQAQRAGAIPIIDSGHKPQNYAMNGLIHNVALQERTVLQEIFSAWFETVSRLKKDANFRSELVRSIVQEQAQEHAPPLEQWMFDKLFADDELEVIVESPAELTTTIASLQAAAIRSAQPSLEVPKQLETTLAELQEAIVRLSQSDQRDNLTERLAATLAELKTETTKLTRAGDEISAALSATEKSYGSGLRSETKPSESEQRPDEGHREAVVAH